MFSINKKTSVSAMIVDKIIHNINTGKLCAGDYLPTELELAENFQVSRNTVREALRVLETYGVIETAHRKPPRVINKNIQASIAIAAIHISENKEHCREIQQIRELIEVGLIEEILVNVTDEDINELQEINNELAQSNTVANLAEYDFKFHIRLIEISNNSMVLAIYSSLSAAILNILEIGKNLEQGIEEAKLGHQRIITALQQGNCADAKLTMAEHFTFTKELLEK